MYDPNYKQNRLCILMRVCLALMPYCRVSENAPIIPDSQHDGVRLCMRYIHNHHAEKITLEEISRYCHLHPSYLCTVFKKHTGQSIFDYLTKVRVESAANLLLREDLPIGKVAELTGFHSECLFYKKFKAIMGTTPKVYAQSAQKPDKNNLRSPPLTGCAVFIELPGRPASIHHDVGSGHKGRCV